MPDEVNNEQIEEQSQVEPQGEGHAPEDMLASEEPQEAGLPEDASERTRREFEKLKEHNRKLAEENKALKGGTQTHSLLDEYMAAQPFVPPTELPQVPSLTQQQVQEVAQQLVDEQGYLNTSELDKRLAKAEEAQRKAQLAEEKANRALERVARYEIDNQKKQLHAAYPELDPSSNVFNPDAYELVKNKLLDQLVKTGEQNPIKAAQEMEKFFRKTPVSPEKQQAISQRSQAMSVGTTGKTTALSSSSYDDLRLRSMTSDEAMDERIRRAGI